MSDTQTKQAGSSRRRTLQRPKRTARVLIVTALPSEYAAVRKHLTSPKEKSFEDGHICEIGQFSGQCMDWAVTLAEVGKGNIDAGLATQALLRHSQAHAVIFVGVAGGLKDVTLGDVVVATKVYYYEQGSEAEEFQARPALCNSTFRMIQRAKADSKADRWRSRAGSVPDVLPTKVLVAPIATGERVVKRSDGDTARLVRLHYNDAIAIEMEGFAVAAASAYTNNKAEVLIIRGISDLLDGKGEADISGMQTIAANHASAFAFEVLSNIELPDIGSASDASTVRWKLVIEGDLGDVTLRRMVDIQNRLREILGDPTVTVAGVSEGSIVLHIESMVSAFDSAITQLQLDLLSAQLGVAVHRIDRDEPQSIRSSARLGVSSEAPGMPMAGEGVPIIAGDEISEGALERRSADPIAITVKLYEIESIVKKIVSALDSNNSELSDVKKRVNNVDSALVSLRECFDREFTAMSNSLQRLAAHARSEPSFGWLGMAQEAQLHVVTVDPSKQAPIVPKGALIGGAIKVGPTVGAIHIKTRDLSQLQKGSRAET